jgi:hypothetical protein
MNSKDEREWPLKNPLKSVNSTSSIQSCALVKNSQLWTDFSLETFLKTHKFREPTWLTSRLSSSDPKIQISICPKIVKRWESEQKETDITFLESYPSKFVFCQVGKQRKCKNIGHHYSLKWNRLKYYHDKNLKKHFSILNTSNSVKINVLVDWVSRCPKCHC